MRRAICARKHRFRIHSDDVNERVYGSLFRTVVSRILYAYFETSDLVSSLVYGHDACLPACLFPLLYVSSLFQSLSRARTRSTVSFLDVCFDRLSFLLIFVKIGYNFGYDYNFRFLTKIPNTNLLFVDCSRIEYDYPIQFSSRNISKCYRIRLLD